MSKQLTETDLQRAADELKAPLAAVKAVCAVESRGSGFLPDGHPIILFERHIMYRQVRDKFGEARAKELAGKFPDIINTTPGGYGKTSEQPGRLDRAAKLDRDCALQSASWGLFQIMGFHWKLLGYATLQAFINAMYRSEGEHLNAFVRFVKANPGMHRALQRLDWAAFARAYNGPAYEKNAYHTKLANEFKKAGGGVA